MIRAADCSPGMCFAEGSLEDLPATILSRMGIETPPHFDGRPLQLIGNRGRASNG